MIANELFQTGNHVAIFASGDDTNELGFGTVGERIPGSTNVSTSQSTGAHGVYTHGDPDPAEIVHGQHAYELTLSLLVPRSQAAADRMNAGAIDIHVVDRLNKKTRAIAEGCVLANVGVSIAANQLGNQNLSFLALRIRQ